jgi:two-component system, cell cycle sensor histidine kinase and response regulator CckA
MFREQVRERMRRLQEDRREVPRVEEIFLRVDGSPFDAEVSAVPFRHEGEPGAMVFFDDITARKQAERDRTRLQNELLHSQKLDSIGRLAGGIAHDFNNLLTVINGYSQLVLSHLAPEDPHHEQLQEVSKAGERAAWLTQQLLAFSRRQVVEPRVLDLNRTVHDMARLLQRVVGEQIQIVQVLEPELGAVVADPGAGVAGADEFGGELSRRHAAGRVPVHRNPERSVHRRGGEPAAGGSRRQLRGARGRRHGQRHGSGHTVPCV